jgi:hypothetical protein
LEARRLCASVVAKLSSDKGLAHLGEPADGKEHNPWATASALLPLMPFLQPDEARSVCQRLSVTLADSVIGEADSDAILSRVESFTKLAAWLEPKDKDHIARYAMSKLVQKACGQPDRDRVIMYDLTRSGLLLSLMSDKCSHVLARLVFFQFAGESDFLVSFSNPTNLREYLIDRSAEAREQLNKELREALESGDPWLIEMALNEPYPCRLSTQDLVELLKMPTVFGEARMVILEHLGNRYHRTFNTHWQFVRYAKEHNLNLDFTTPPQRSDPKGLADRILKILE